MCYPTVTSWSNPTGGHGWLLPSQLSSWRLRPALSSWMAVAPCLTVKPHPDWSFSDISVHYEILRFAVFLNEKLDLWLCFACWPFSTVLPQVSWQECLVETPESVWVPFPLLGLLVALSAGIIAWPIQGLLRPKDITPSIGWRREA